MTFSFNVTHNITRFLFYFKFLGPWSRHALYSNLFRMCEIH